MTRNTPLPSLRWVLKMPSSSTQVKITTTTNFSNLRYIAPRTTLRSFQCRWSRYERSRRKVTLKIEFIDNNIYCTTCTAARYNIHILKYFTQHVRSAAPLALIKFLKLYNYINKPINIAYSQAISSLESPLMARRALLDVSLTLRSTLCDLWT